MPLSVPKPQLADVIAGVSVALVLIPQSVAYASLAGMPAQIGLFASAAPLLVFSLFASSPFLQSGPTAVSSLLTFSALAGTGYAVETLDYVKAGALLALLVGLIRLALGIFKLGAVAFVVAEPVMIGFTSGAAVVIFSTQLPKVLGVVPPESVEGPLNRAVSAFTSFGDWQIGAIAIAVMTLVFMLGGKRLHPLFPGVLFAVIAGVVVSLVFSLEGSYPRATAGDPNEIPGNFPSLGLDLPWGDLGIVIVGAIVIAIVGFAEPSAIARTYANEERQHWNASQELAASGLANLTSAASGTYPIGGSFSRSSLNKLAGAQTRWSGGVTGLVVLACLPLAPLLNDLPNAVLGAIVIGAVISLLKPKRLAQLWSRSKTQALLAYVTLVLTVWFAPDVYWAIAVGFVLTLVHHVGKPVAVVATETTNGDAEITPEGLVWIASTTSFVRELNDAIDATGDAAVVTLNLRNTPSVDAGMAHAIAVAAARLEADGRQLNIASSPAGGEQLIASSLAGLTPEA